MNCEECKKHISLFLDDELDVVQADAIRSHLAICDPCAKVCEDFASILDFCHTEPADEILPPNSQAMWCRINNLIESEIKEDQTLPDTQRPRRRLWEFSLWQLVTAASAVIVVSSLLTVIGIKNYLQPTGEDFTSRDSASVTTFEKLLSRVGLTETPQQARQRRLKEQEAAIEYWNQRVQQRRAVWDKNLRDAFDRNLNVINESVSEYTLILQQNPDDDLSGEMLDTALREKMDLLREFSEL